MMRVTLYRAELLNDEKNNIIPNLEGYLATQLSEVVEIPHDFELYDDITLELNVSNIDLENNASYVKCENVESGQRAFYYVARIDRVTPNTNLFTLSRDYVNEYLSRGNIGDVNVFGQYVAGHYPLNTANLSYTLPCETGFSHHLKRTRPVIYGGFGGTGEVPEFGIVFRVVLDRYDKLLSSKVLLIRSEYTNLQSAIRALYTILAQAETIFVHPTDDSTVGPSYDVVEITNAWIVPEGFLPFKFEGHEVIFKNDTRDLVDDTGRGFSIGVPSQGIDYHYYEVDTYTNTRCYFGNALSYIEVPFSPTTPKQKVTVVSYYGADSMLSITARACGQCVDLTNSMDIGSDLFSNSSATLSGKISRALGVLTGALSVGVSAYTGNPIGVAGGALSVASSLSSGIGARTAVNGSGADGIQSVYVDIDIDTSGASILVGPLGVFYYSVDNALNIRATINMFGVFSNFAYRGTIGGFMINKYQFTRFDNVRVYNLGTPPQFRSQLREMLTRGVYIWNRNPQNYELEWDGDFHEL